MGHVVHRHGKGVEAMRRNQRAQATAEYAILAAAVIGVLAIMYGYIRQSAMGRMRGAGDQIGEQLTPGTYEVTTNVTRSESTSPSGVSSSTIISKGGEVQERKLIN